MTDFNSQNPDQNPGAEAMPAATTEAPAPPNKNRDFYRPFTFFLLAVLGVLLVFFNYRYPLLRTWDSWGSEHGYNANGLYIFIGACLLIFMQRKQLRALPKRISYCGLVLVVGALLWSLAFKRGDINAMQTIGLVGLLWALCFYWGGWLLAKAMMFPLFLSLFSVQWGLASSTVSLKMRLLSTKLACDFINLTGHLLGVTVLRQGTNVSMVDMPELQFDVAAACSGLQSLIMTTVLCLLLAYLMLRTWWKRVIMLALIPPVAILNNSMRIVLIAYSGKFFTWLEHVFHLADGWGSKVMVDFHVYPGMIVYMLGFGIIWLAAHYLERLPGVERADWLERKAAKHAKKTAADESDRSAPSDFAPPVPAPDYSYYGTLWKHVLLVLALAFVMYHLGNYAKHSITYAQGLPTASDLLALTSGKALLQPLHYVTAFPSRVGGRVRIEMPVSDEELTQLPKDTAYYRGLFVASNLYEHYVRAASALLSDNVGSNASAQLAAQRLQAALPDATLSTVAVARIVQQALMLRAAMPRWLQAGSAPQQVLQVALGHLLSNIASVNRHADDIMLAVVQNESDQHSIHTPEACYPGQGWTIDDAVPTQIILDGRTTSVARMEVGFKQADIQECVVYWYQREWPAGRVYATSDFFWLPFKTAFNLIFRGRSDRWAFVRFSTARSAGEQSEDTYQRLLSFIRDVEPYLGYTD
jgi:exosortase